MAACGRIARGDWRPTNFMLPLSHHVNLVVKGTALMMFLAQLSYALVERLGSGSPAVENVPPNARRSLVRCNRSACVIVIRMSHCGTSLRMLKSAWRSVGSALCLASDSRLRHNRLDYASQIGLGCGASASPEGASHSNVQVSCGLACPNCASPCVLPVRYGVLNQRLSDALRAGACVYGGRVLSDNSPELACTVCGARFDAPDGDTRK